MTTTQKIATLEFIDINLDDLFNAYFETDCRIKNVERLILRDEKLWNSFFSNPKFMLIDLDYLQSLFIDELKIWRKEFTEYFA